MAEPQYRYLAPRVEQGVLVLTITHPHLRSTQFDLPDVLREEMLRAVAQAKANKVVVDLSKVEQLGSANFRPLLSLRRQLHEAKGQLLLAGLQPDIRDVFLVTRLIDEQGSSLATFGVAADTVTAVTRLNAGAV